MPRLVGKGIILSRLGGGIGTRGPGEQKLEVDRRRITKRIDKLKDELKGLKTHRLTMRKKRKDKAVPQVALVGYTNAGKSTLLNALTDSDQIVSNSLFTTLDPLNKSLALPNGEHIIISDTVGFLHNLPHHLIEAFKATLEETAEADLLLHVLDAAHPRAYEHNRAVLKVIEGLKVDKKPIVTVLNKIDLLEDEGLLERLKKDFPDSVAVSARLRHNFDLLLKRIESEFAAKMASVEILIPHSRMDLVDLCYREGKIEKIEYLQAGVNIKAILPKILCDKVLHNNRIQLVNEDI
ncbi:MAG: GTPase HflX [Candidatus Omnitrophota bacterium]|jgi:GTP-binding protein HflX